MKSFTFYNPTKLIFGRDQLQHVGRELKLYGQKILLVYGKQSIKKNGLYDQVMEHLRKEQMEVYELANVDPNPRMTSVYEGIRICKEFNIDVLLAVGGGSVIDCTKAIAAGACTEADMWQMIKTGGTFDRALPFGTVLTIAATGSEMNSGSVITNWETNEKLGWGSPHVFPKFSILDPTNTFSLSKEQTVYGMVDIMSHVFEHYFHQEPNTILQDAYCEALLRTVIQTAPLLLNDLTNYAYRETILYCGTMALNGTLNMGYSGDWATHAMEHAVSAVYDVPHGAGLAILFPSWMQYHLKMNPERFAQLAVNVFGIPPEGKSDTEIGQLGIESLRTFWNSLGAPCSLDVYDIPKEKIQMFVEKAMISPTLGRFNALKEKDVEKIYQLSF